jgi:hypothetical protein
MNQKDAVFQAVYAVISNGNEEHEIHGKVELSKDQKKQVHTLLIAEFLAGRVEFRGTMNEEVAKDYVPGLVNNWLRKDKRLNGGEKYVPKNPGSRQGSGDEALKMMRSLLKITTDPEDRKAIEKEIAAREAVVKAAKQPVIDPAKLPESLRHLVKATPPASAENASATPEPEASDAAADEGESMGDGEPAQA